jgi:branched-chain amino acid transport system ATP-binding protein
MTDDHLLLEVDDLVSGYGSKTVLNKVSLDLRKNEVVVVLGLNGVGKTTLLKTIMGFLSVDKGSIRFDKREITSLKTTQRVKAGVSLMPQEDPVFPNMTVGENLEMGGWLIREEYEKRETLNEMYHLFPRLDERKRQKAGSLSGGERQMLAVARALMIKPKLLMMDEPSLGLMPKLVDAIFEKIVEIKKQGVAILLVEQNNKALDYVDRGYIMDIGSITFGGSAMELRSQIVF